MRSIAITSLGSSTTHITDLSLDCDEQTVQTLLSVRLQQISQRLMELLAFSMVSVKVFASASLIERI